MGCSGCCRIGGVAAGVFASEGGGPAGQQTEPVVGWSAGAAVKVQVPAGIGGQVKAFVGELEVADDGVVEAFDAGAVEADVVGGPPGAERIRAGDEFADEGGERFVAGCWPA